MGKRIWARALGAVAVAFGAALAARPAAAEPTDAFIARLAPHAEAVSRETGVPASVILGVAALESGWGKSGLARRCHNYFGIKGRGPSGAYRSATREYDGGVPYTITASFRCYRSPEESMRDYAAVLSNPRYRRAWAHTDNPFAFIREVHRAGYATDPHYAAKVISIIRRWDLRSHDPVAASTATPRRGMVDALGGTRR